MTTTTYTLWPNGHRRRGQQLTGGLLVLLGGFWFAHKAGWIPVSAEGLPFFWPLFIIAIGLALWLKGARHTDRNAVATQRKEIGEGCCESKCHCCVKYLPSTRVRNPARLTSLFSLMRILCVDRAFGESERIGYSA